jgi:MATE family multidrug resistance protein
MMFFPIAICGIGLLLGMDTLVAQAFGRGDLRDCRRTLVNGVWLGAALSPLVVLVLWSTIPLLRAVGTNPRALAIFEPYLKALTIGVLPLLLYTAFRRYLQAVNVVKPITFALVSANLINIAGDWAFMYGHCGLPALGVPGSGFSTSISRTYMAAVLLGAIFWHERKSGSLLFSIPWRPDFARLRSLVSLGLPAAGQMLFEGAVFGIVTAMAARLDAVSLAAHGIAVNVIGTTFMVPLGISSAAAVRVGQACGRKDARGASTAGSAAMLLSAVFMSAAGLVLWLVPQWIVRIYIRDTAVVSMGGLLLRIAAVFELFDGLQITATGALRGLGDTRTPMLAHLVGYWVIGLPTAYVLCFPLGWGAPGIWVGLSAALILIGAALALVWRHAISAAAGR